MLTQAAAGGKPPATVISLTFQAAHFPVGPSVGRHSRQRQNLPYDRCDWKKRCKPHNR
ncbi:hypothetical protein SAMN05421753_103270 [Planctomicrobium piriforme]|uniref:Uncharacterized protein n=1 Tax=Planctomicrobium piriforme TaxID=1576369 RepID=A0A1I3DJA1_9PLAN|nr:hypothetical protein SAMN05421753_103270 [Planctomicrobium piriforme]